MMRELHEWLRERSAAGKNIFTVADLRADGLALGPAGRTAVSRELAALQREGRICPVKTAGALRLRIVSMPVNSQTRKPALSDVLMEAAWRVARHGSFSAAELMADPQVAEYCPVPHRVACQAQYLAGTGWMVVTAGHPVPRWALSAAWQAEFGAREADSAGG
jgi:hypothetical protein